VSAHREGPVDLALAEDLERPVESAHGTDRPEQLLVDRDRGRLGSLGALFGGLGTRKLTGFERTELHELGDATQVHDLELRLRPV